ncbi:hypothetical protein Mnod_5642 [Methylobacterium nodulans ORS 2060]|uniref:Uncharacterized protein n=1 Tax=Methylobacterium nodulans (strain LMG 21967 / CNCM I-2342 / ORS 2060) TaxID=460265 RepID=B8IQH0_METNO|nr:hypothetical protein Mnod_5642 [Methylobacterium nodulans ORS 2060]
MPAAVRGGRTSRLGSFAGSHSHPECEPWTKLFTLPDTITTIGLRDRARIDYA